MPHDRSPRVRQNKLYFNHQPARDIIRKVTRQHTQRMDVARHRAKYKLTGLSAGQVPLGAPERKQLRPRPPPGRRAHGTPAKRLPSHPAADSTTRTPQQPPYQARPPPGSLTVPLPAEWAGTAGQLEAPGPPPLQPQPETPEPHQRRRGLVLPPREAPPPPPDGPPSDPLPLVPGSTPPSPTQGVGHRTQHDQPRLAQNCILTSPGVEVPEAPATSPPAQPSGCFPTPGQAPTAGRLRHCLTLLSCVLRNCYRRGA